MSTRVPAMKSIQNSLFVRRVVPCIQKFHNLALHSPSSFGLVRKKYFTYAEGGYDDFEEGGGGGVTIFQLQVLGGEGIFKIPSEVEQGIVGGGGMGIRKVSVNNVMLIFHHSFVRPLLVLSTYFFGTHFNEAENISINGKLARIRDRSLRTVFSRSPRFLNFVVYVTQVQVAAAIQVCDSSFSWPAMVQVHTRYHADDVKETVGLLSVYRKNDRLEALNELLDDLLDDTAWPVMLQWFNEDEQDY